MDRIIRDFIDNKVISSTFKQIFGHYTPHFHDFYEIEYVTNGSGVCVVNGEEYNFTDGMLFFITPIDYHSVRTTKAELYNIMFSEQLVDFKLLAPFLQYQAPKAIKIDAQNRAFFNEIFKEITKNESNFDYSSALLSCLMMKLEQLYPICNKAQSTEFSKIHSYIINNYRNKITLKDLSKHVGLSPNYVCSIFKKQMKIGFKEYLTSLRMEYASKLLHYTDHPIKQICEESGFDDVPNFIKRFKSYYKVTPKEARQKKMANKQNCYS